MQKPVLKFKTEKQMKLFLERAKRAKEKAAEKEVKGDGKRER